MWFRWSNVKKSDWFYLIVGLALAVAGLNAFARTVASGAKDPDPKHYTYMAPDARLAEFRTLQAEVAKSDAVTPERYFQILARIRKLDEAVYRARKEENLDGRMPTKMPNEFSVNFLTQDWTNRRDNDRSFYRNATVEDIDRARASAGLNDDLSRHTMPRDPFVPTAWAIFYTVGLVFAFGRFAIAIEQMGGCWWQSAIADWRFPFWMTIWFIGVFKYPTKIDVIYQVQRAYRFAVLVLSSTISIAAAGCAAKRVNIEPETLPDHSATTWQVDTNTTLWPSYIGGNGAVFHPEPVQQTSVTATAASGLYGNIWHSASLGGRDLKPNFGSEIDGAIGWGGKVGSYGVDTSLTWVGVTPLAHYKGDVIQLSASVSRALPYGFGVSSTLNAVTPARRNGPRSGRFFRNALNWSKGFGRASVDASGEIFHDSGAFGFERGWLARGSASVGVRIGEHWKVGIPIRWNTPLSTVSDGRRKELQGGLIVSWQP